MILRSPKKYYIPIYVYTVLITVSILTSCVPATVHNTFTYQIRVLEENTLAPVYGARVRIITQDTAPMEDTTDLNGLAMIDMDIAQVNQSGKLIVEASGYEGYEAGKYIILTEEALPNVIYLKQIPTPTLILTQTPTPIPTLPPTPPTGFIYHKIYVRDEITENPIPGAKVQIRIKRMSPVVALTDSDGVAVVAVETASTEMAGTLTIEAPGYKSYETSVYIDLTTETQFGPVYLKSIGIAPILLAPAPGGTFKNPIAFQWSGMLNTGQAYQVTAYHLASGYKLQSQLLTNMAWTVDLPGDKFGEWRWNVSIVDNGADIATSHERMFWFQSFGVPSGGSSNGPLSTDTPPP